MAPPNTSKNSSLSALVRSIGGRLRRLRGPGPRADDAPHIALGQWGEQAAARHLVAHGYKVLYKNFRGKRGGEIDLVCRDRSCDTLVFVEVKTRSSELFGSPGQAVDARKRKRIIGGAMAWLRMLDMPDISFRFDVVEVIVGPPTEIRVIESAFNLPEIYIY